MIYLPFHADKVCAIPEHNAKDGWLIWQCPRYAGHDGYHTDHEFYNIDDIEIEFFRKLYEKRREVYAC